jgi:hypothetical protein
MTLLWPGLNIPQQTRTASLKIKEGVIMSDWKKDYWSTNNEESSESTDWKKNYWSADPKSEKKNLQTQTPPTVTPEFLNSQQDKLLGLNVLKTAVQQTPANLQRSLGGIAQSFEEIPNPLFEKAIQENDLQPVNPQFQNIGQGMVQDATRQIDLIKKQNQIEPGSTGEFIANTAGSIIETGPALAAAALTKNPTLLLAQTGLTSFGQTYAGNRESGASPQESLISAAGAGALDTGLNVVPFGQLIKPGATLGKKLLSQVVEQGLSNALAETGKAGIDKLTVNPEMTLSEAGQRIGTGTATGAALGGAMSLGVEPFIKRPVIGKKVMQNVQQESPTMPLKIAENSMEDVLGNVRQETGQPLGIVFKPKNLGKRVDPRSKSLVVNQPQTQLEAIAPTLDKIVDYKQTKTPLRKIPSLLYQKLVDNQHAINQFTKQTGLKTASIDPYKMASNSRSAPGTVNYVLTEGLVNKKGEKIGASFKSIVDRVPKQFEQQFNDYLLHRHNRSRMGLKQRAQNFADNYLTNNPEIPKIGEKNIRKLEQLSRTYTKLIEEAKGRLNRFEAVHPEFVNMSIDEIRGMTRLRSGDAEPIRAKEASKYLKLINDVESFVDKFNARGADFEGMNIKDINELQSTLEDVGGPAWEYLKMLDRAEKTKNKPVFGDETTSELSQQKLDEYDKVYPEFKGIADQYDKFMKNFMGEWGNKSGLVSDDLWAVLQDTYPNYTPTYRAQEDAATTNQFGVKKKFTNQSSPIKKATGGNKPILNPLETSMRLVDKTIKAAKYNEVGQTIVDAIRQDPEGTKQWAEIVDDDGSIPGVKTTAEADGIEGVMDEFVAQYDQPKIKLNGKNIVRVMENGKPVYLKINDKLFLESVTGLTDYTPGTAEKAARWLTTPYKALITGKNPIFTVKNIARDIPTAYINGSIKNPFKFYQNLATAAKEMASNSKMFQEYKALGGGQSGFFKAEKGLGKNLYKRDNLVNQANEGVEALPRYAEYRNIVLRGKNTYDAKMEGLFRANEITTNFSRHGNLTKAVDAFVPYLNPGFQGLDKLVRQAVKNPLATVGKGVLIITIPQVATTLMNMNNPNYEQLDNRTKDVYYLIPMWWEKDEKGNPNQFIKIPKAREYGVILGDTFDRMIRAMRGEPNAFEGFLYRKGEGLKGVSESTVATQFSPTNPLENNILSPLVTNLPSNKDFAGRTIVPQSLKGASPEYQYDETTSEIGKVIGSLLKVSPKQADYLIKSYTGYIGQFVLPMTTKSGMSLKPVEAARNVLTRNFTADPLFSNEIMNTFYNNKEKLDTMRTNLRVAGKPITDENLALQKTFTRAADRISDYNKKIKQAKTEEEKRLLRQQMLEEAKKYNAMVK